MASAFLKSTRLKLVFEVFTEGMDKPVYKNKIFSNIHRDANADQLYQAAQAIGALSEHPIWAIERNDSFDIDA
ncbi:DUF1659 domain-containing protein [Siminovitchia fortis]|uniref:DUF1659 domain-containing protein n=1 Tax=Siminovitchia fortis TaxID=254758 RepID=A0A443IU90_9BACI|nr:DUF1659 domain-containing protein [Siminovitchia fortis]RWR11669.1 DUF1659 domain-containing protein [Siminovitchia fortis]WHY83202.1 DUF1659 domain-containing protein [Siminovitchia fortis]